MASIKSAFEATATRGPLSVFGQVNLVSDTGEILNLWRVREPRCLIGSGPMSTILLNEPGIAGEHALIVFGKNRTLIKTLGNSIRIAGRSITETLIDEPTHIQCGNSRLLIIPPRFANREDFAAHQVSSGTLADQTARLKNYPTRTKSRDQQFIEPEQSPVSDNAASAARIPEVAVQSPASPPSPAIDLSPILSALAPIQNAISETQDRLASLQSQVQESETRLETANNVQDLKPDLSQLIDRIDERMGAFTNQCESLFSTVAESLDSRFNQLGDLVQKLCESSIVPADPACNSAASQTTSVNEFGEHSSTFAPPFDAEHGYADATATHQVESFVTEDDSETSSDYEAEAFHPAYEEPVAYQSEDEPPAAYQLAFEEPIDYQPEYEQPVSYQPANEDAVASQPEYEQPDDYQSASVEPVGYQPTYEGSVSYEESDSYPYSSYQESTQAEPVNLNDPKLLAGSDSHEGERVEPSNAMPKLPDWFTGYRDPTPEVQAEVGQEFATLENDSAELGSIGSHEVSEEFSVDPSSEWASAKLNPIYAEDTTSWLNEIRVLDEHDDHAEASPSDSEHSERTVYDQERQIETVSNGHSEAFDYNAYDSANATATEGREFEDASATGEELFQREEIADDNPSDLSSDDVSQESLEERSDSHFNALDKNETTLDDSSEESIEDYMNRLLQRVKGSPAEAAPANVISQPSRPSTRVIKPELPKADMCEESIEANFGFSSSDSNADSSSTESMPNASAAARRSKPVEREENLSALRDLANLTARSAIQKSSQKKLTTGITGKASVALAGLAGGLFLLFVNGLNVNIAMLAMICSFIIFLLWGYEAIEQTKQLAQQNVKDTKQQPDSKATAEQRPAGDGSV